MISVNGKAKALTHGSFGKTRNKMYDPSDPRSALSQGGARQAPSANAFAKAEFGLFYNDNPQEDDANGRTWFCRGQNFVIAYSEARAGAVFARPEQLDEYMVLIPDRETPFVAEAGKQTETASGYSVVIMPPGRGEIRLPSGGRVVRVFSTRSPDLNAKCANAAAFAQPHPHVPPFEAWPEPVAGFKIRVYSLDVPDQPGRFGRIWRCTTVMLNFLPVQMGPRDITKLSPHHHDDFEQCSLALDGSFVHHMRWPWTVDMNAWLEDQHPHVLSPSVTVIPPPAIHTSRGMDSGANQLVDIFAPPRLDFSQKDGWVLNAEEYPLPGDGFLKQHS
ncbi:MAG: hypothetical protein M9924_20160 [Rhizobiaceae bacterium]|nr:hypothetical protein [Rhizobiaceae bacterium]